MMLPMISSLMVMINDGDDEDGVETNVEVMI